MSTAVPNHRRTKPGGIKPGAANSGVTGPTSQIPGLCQSATDSAPAERVSGRRVGIFESDSDYVKLAKQGGHKGLLSHDGDDDDKPKKAYNPPNWFGDDESKSDSKATSPNSQTKGERRPLAAPFGTDNSPTWEREPDRFSNNKDQDPYMSVQNWMKDARVCWEPRNFKAFCARIDNESQASPDGAADHMEGLSLGSKYKRRSYDKKTPPVSMSKLLSHGYMENKKKSSNDDDTSSVTSEHTSTTMTEDVDDLE